MNTDNLKSEIKKVKVGHVALLCTGIFLAFLIIGSICVAAGGGLRIIGGQGMQWGSFFMNVGPGQLYDVNDHKALDAAGVDSIAITSVSGDVTIQAGGDQVTADLVGQCRTAGTPVHLETSVSGGALHIDIKYPVASNFDDTKLTVTIPASYGGGLSVTSVSGGIHADGLPFALQGVSLGSVSGDIDFSAASFTSIRAGTTSGDIKIGNIDANTDVHSISGGISLDYTSVADTTASTVSGDVSAAIPSTDSFGVDFGSVSGTFRSTHPGLNVSSADRGFESSKPGAPTIKVNTTSGDFRISGK